MAQEYLTTYGFLNAENTRKSFFTIALQHFQKSYNSRSVLMYANVRERKKPYFSTSLKLHIMRFKKKEEPWRSTTYK